MTPDDPRHTRVREDGEVERESRKQERQGWFTPKKQ